MIYHFSPQFVKNPPVPRPPSAETSSCSEAGVGFVASFIPERWEEHSGVQMDFTRKSIYNIKGFNELFYS